MAGSEGDTVLDAMLEAAFGGSATTRSEGNAPRRVSKGRPRGVTHSASPRPQRWRPVDAVREAKNEVAQIDGKGNAFNKLRLGSLPAPPSGGNDGSCHDGFYDFAAAVVKPQPTARQYASQLRAQLDDGLRDAQTLAKGADGDDRGDLHAGMILAAERSKREVEVCIETLERFAVDTTTDSKEREAMLQQARRASSHALKKILSLMGTCCHDLEDAEHTKHGLESTLHQLDEDNTGLRHVMQKMLGTEGELRQQVTDLESEIDVLKRDLQDSRFMIGDEKKQRDRVAAELQELRDELARGRPTTDQCSSPMMGFSAFMMSTDEVPNLNASELGGEGMPSWARPESFMNPGGFVPQLSTGNPRRKTVTENAKQTLSIGGKPGGGGTRLSATGSGVGAPRLSMMMDLPGDPTSISAQKRGSQLPRGSRSACVSPSFGEEHSRGSKADAMIAAMTTQASQVLNYDHRSVDSKDEPNSRPTSDHGHPDDFATHPSLLATSFPSLLPFVDFHMLDPELEKSQADAIALNSEHLEKHLTMLREDYEKEVSQTEELQHGVDTCLERILVWVQAIHDSLQDLNSNAIQQDVRALISLRNAVDWLAKHPCKEWMAQAGHLDEVLDEHETELRGHLAVERPNDSELEELRKTLAQQRQKVQDLSDQLLEARASVGGPVRAQRRIAHGSTARRTSSFREGAGDPVQHIAIQCDLIGGTAFMTETEEAVEAAEVVEAAEAAEESPRRMSRRLSASSSNVPSKRPSRVGLNDSPGKVKSPMSEDSDPMELPAGLSIEEPESFAVEDAPAPAPADETHGAEEANALCGEPEAEPALRSGRAAVDVAVREAKIMLLLRSPFVEAIDFTVVPADSRVLLSHQPCEDGGRSDDKLLGPKQLRTFIADVYIQKNKDDVQRDKLSQPRRALYVLLQEHIRRTHGVKKVVHQKSWQLIESLNRYGSEDKMVDMFTDFLDGSRDIDEHSFYLYCAAVFATGSAEDSHTLQFTRFPEGVTSYSRAVAVIELLFGDLPKALAVMKIELEKVLVLDGNAEQDARSRLAQQVKEGALMTSHAFNEGVAFAALCVLTDHLYEILLEGWRMSALLLDQSIPTFSWRQTILAFAQADVCHRGWLDPHEVKQAEVRRLQVDAYTSDSLAIQDRTSLGAFVFRGVQRCSKAAPSAQPAPSPPSTLAPGAGRPKGAAERRRMAQRKASDAALQVSGAAFESVKKSLEVYLTWMMHSDELRDLAVYRSVKAQIFNFHQASSLGQAASVTHHLRSLLLVLLAHQFDVQYQQEDVNAEQLDWELRGLLQILRECWKRGANSEAGPEFGIELEAIGDAAAPA